MRARERRLPVHGGDHAGAVYKGRADLGNTQAGDGKRYKGRGPIQLTGQANDRHVGRQIGIDLERHPEAVSLPLDGPSCRGIYWGGRKLNAKADDDDLMASLGRSTAARTAWPSEKLRPPRLRG